LVRDEILRSAAFEFSSLGFDGASTRSIAERSGVHQAQIGYHVGSKEDLWRATVDFLFERLRTHLDRALPTNFDLPVVDPTAVFAEIIRRHVIHTAKHPELSRIMLMESATRSARVEWLLKTHVRPTLAALDLVWSEVRASGGGRNATTEEVFMMMVGLAPTPFAQAGLMRPLLGAERCTPNRHAETIINWILG
jgi:TetR/AcrR family transcriptional regulator